MPGQQKVQFERNVEISMRDGAILRADVYRPSDDKPHPVLLNRTPYNKQGVMAIFDAIKAAGLGYIVVAQDCRGRFNSDGTFYPFLDETQDGYDTVEWIAAQSWCSGEIGMFGLSYMGATQWLAAIGKPPHLTTIVPAVTASDYHDGWTYQSGAFLLGFSLSWTLSSFAISNLSRLEPPEETLVQLRKEIVAAIDDAVPSYRYLPLEDYPLLKLAELAPYYYDWLAHPSEDDYWKRWNIERFYEQLEIPVFNIGGWYDIFLGGTLRNYVGMRERGGSANARESRLMVGPWYHGAPLMGQMSGDVNFGVGATGVAAGLDDAMIRWYDYWLKGERNGITAEPAVTVFTMGENRWHTYPSWPPPGSSEETWYFHSNGKANTLDGDGTLSVGRPVDELPDVFLYDPRNPVPTRGGGLCCGPTMGSGGAFDQRTIEGRPDVLVYTSDPLTCDIEVSGAASVSLWASSSAPDTDFTAKLVDVSPDGYARNLIDNLIRARYRSSLENPMSIEPNKSYLYAIDLYGTSNLFRAGHRIRVEISSSNFPRFDRNPNTGKPIAEETNLIPALQTVFHDSLHPSALLLTVRER